MAQHRDPFDPHAEGEAGDEGPGRRPDRRRRRRRSGRPSRPRGSRASPSPCTATARAVAGAAAAVEAGHVDLDARLGEGKEIGFNCTSGSSPKIARANASSVPLRSAKVTPSSTASPSTWWNCGVWVASLSGRYTRPGTITNRGGGAAIISPDLHRRGVGPQHGRLVEVERVAARARRMRRRGVQGCRN